MSDAQLPKLDASGDAGRRDAGTDTGLDDAGPLDSGPSPVEILIHPSADTYVCNNEGADHGAEAVLRVGFTETVCGFGQAAIFFDVNEIRAQVSGASLLSAQVRLTVRYGGTLPPGTDYGRLSLARILVPWAEDTSIRLTAGIDVESDFASSAILSSDPPALPVSIDVSGRVQDILLGEVVPNNGWLVTGGAGSALISADIASRETATPPTLVLTVLR